MNPKHLERSVSLSIIKLHESTTPPSLNRARSSVLVVSGERFPINNFADIKNYPFGKSCKPAKRFARTVASNTLGTPKSFGIGFGLVNDCLLSRQVTVRVTGDPYASPL